ncbi:FAD/NAD(P)-binding protein [Fructilactobacillus sp. Tb1]|uniref:FAD/NAD(P)-binding protein n=1 Tax=Fructilactobacillus sp. Tb1 TaxID=3422304 RepID=UPI003D2D842A
MKIAIIGAGPRGLMMLQSLLKNLPQPAEIALYDPYPIGGKVWQTNQSLDYLMNSTAQLITLFNDLDQDELTGPTLYDWAKSPAAKQFIKQQKYANDFALVCEQLQANDFAPRALFGVYCQWFYHELRNHQSTEIKINFINDEVVNVDKNEQQYNLSTNQTSQTYDALIISTGTSANRLSDDQESLTNYAAKYDLTYLAPGYVTDANLAPITADQTVLLRGMGLNFFDYLAAFTTGRGGKFVRNANGELDYQASGQEPHLVAGSRRGVPYYPKTSNELPVGHHLPLYFMNWNQINANLVDGKLPYAKFFALFQAEIENRYYQLLINLKYPKLNAKDFCQEFVASKDHKATIQKYNFAEDDILDWNLLANPVAGISITTTAAYQKILLQWIELITNDAKLGSLHAPITGALTIFVDMRTTIQKLVVDHYFTNTEYLQKFLGEFSPFTGFLTSGPPTERYEQLIALMKAGIVTIVPPQLQVMGANHHFIARSHFYPGEIFTCDAMIEARLPKPDLRITEDPVLTTMHQEKLINNYAFQVPDGNYPIGAIAVSADYNVNQQNLYFWGLPITGLEWMTTTLPHALSHDRNFVISDKIAQLIARH